MNILFHNEYKNSRVRYRQYIPKNSDFTELRDDDIIKIQEYLNNRPRKSLGYLTPYEIFAAKAALKIFRSKTFNMCKKLSLIQFAFAVIGCSLLINSAIAAPNTFLYKNKPIHPLCLAPFFPGLGDMNTAAAQQINLTRCSIKQQGVSIKFSYNFYHSTKKTGNGSYSYRVLGKTQQGSFVVLGVENTGGSGQFESLFLFQIIYQAQTAMLHMTQYIDLGDRCTGGLKNLIIKPKKLIITQFAGKNAGDCSKTVTRTIMYV